MKNTKTKIQLILTACAFVFAIEGEAVNSKFQFINEIYSESWALVIGINKYQNVDQLNYAVNDAIAVKEMLVSKYGFKESHIKLITDEQATKNNILKGFSDILTQAKEKDRVVVFYAGHGETYKLPSGGDMGFLLPVDGNLDNLYLSSIPMKEIYGIADMSYAKHILYLVDACYGGLTLASTRGLKMDNTPEYIKKMTKERGRQVITAGGKGEQVLEKAEWGHSAFTKSLLNGLGEGYADENMDGIITADELGGFIKNRVIVDVDGAHTPQKGRIGSDMGEFVFISETLEDEIADNSPASEQFTNLETEMAEIKKLLLLQSQGRGAKEVEIPKNNSVVVKNKKSNRNINMQTASILSWIFPGMGHFYSGQLGKGVFFTGIELFSAAALIGLLNDFDRYSNEYQIALRGMDNYKTDPGTYNFENSEATVLKLRSKKNNTQIAMIGTGMLSAGIWFWNIRDLKKMSQNKYSENNKVLIGLNQYRQIEVKMRF